jgi:pathogenesis-related protein 1
MKSVALILCLVLTTGLAFGQTVPKETGSKATQQAAQEALDHHNKVRKDVGAPPLEWSTELATYAQAWADNQAKNKNCKMEHRPRSGEWTQKHGENIFWGSASSYTILDASESWYSEIKDYKHGPISDINWPVAGHYTQMVWKNTTKLGIGVATCPNGNIFIVANYDPAGNYWGEKPY